jgi:hypothetical protein
MFHLSKVKSDFEMKTVRGIGGIILMGGNRIEQLAEKSVAVPLRPPQSLKCTIRARMWAVAMKSVSIFR